MVQTTTQFAYLDELYDELVAVPALADVHVISAGLDLDKSPKPDLLQIFGTGMDEAFAALGNLTHEEEYDVTGEIVVLRAGAGQEKAKATRDRAQAIFAELETVVRTNHKMNDTVAWSRISRVAIAQGYSDKGRICVIEFTIRAKAQLRLS